MKKMTKAELTDRIIGLWQQEDAYISNSADQIANVIEGSVEYHSSQQLYEGHHITFNIIKNPTYRITNSQLCQIMDDDTGIKSSGSIIYEGDYAYITWSNHAHFIAHNKFG